MEPTPWYYAEFTKGLFQFVAVGAGVWIGWTLNGLRDKGSKIKQARADWAAAAEDCLGALRSQADANATAVTSDHPAFAHVMSDIAERTRASHEAMSRFRAASVRLVLMDDHEITTHGVELSEDEIVGIELWSQGPQHDLNFVRDHVEKARGNVRAQVDIWKKTKRRSMK